MKKYSLPHAMLLLFLIFSSTESFSQPSNPGPDPDIMDVTIPVFPKKESSLPADANSDSILHIPSKNMEVSSEFQPLSDKISLVPAVAATETMPLMRNRRTPKG